MIRVGRSRRVRRGRAARRSGRRADRSGWRRSRVAATLAGAPLATRLDARLHSASAARGTESAEFARRVAEEFDSPFANHAILVIEGIRSAGSDEGRARVRSIVERLETLPVVGRTLSPATSLDTMLVGSGDDGAVAIVGLRPDADREPALLTLREVTAAIASENPDLRLVWSGESALNRDLRKVGTEAMRRAEVRALPIAAVLSFWAFRSVAAALLAAIFGAVTVTVSMGLTYLLADWVALSGRPRSAPTITGAAAVMIGIFAVLTAAPVVPMKEFAFVLVLALAIAIDATVIRLVVAPAALRIAGRWNWWPGRSLR